MSNEELLSLFRSVIKEELVPIREEIRGVKTELQAEMKDVKSELQAEMKSFKSELQTEIKGVKSETKDNRSQMNFRFDTLEMKTSHIETKLAYVEHDVAAIKATVDHMSGEVPQDVMGMLKQMNSKLDDKDSDVQALNKRLFRVESTLERVTTVNK